MSARRTIKKTIYASIFCVIVVGVVVVIVRPLFPSKDTSPTTAPIQTYIPITIENIVVLPHLDNPGPFGKTIDVVARLKNENARAGTGNYPVTLIVKNPKGEVINTIEQVAYVLPGGVQYIAFIDVFIPSDQEFGTVDVRTPENITLSSLPDTARLPEFSVFLRERTQVLSGTQHVEWQKGIVTNTSTFDWEKVEVTGVALDQNGKIVGVGKTFVGKLLLNEQREFTIGWPMPTTPTNRVIAIATTNVYSDGNVVHILGDPNALR